MSDVLPSLRLRLDVMPSPVPDRPGLLLRDPLAFASGMLIVPPPLVPLLSFFDGTHRELDVKAEIVRRGGSIEAAGVVVGQLREALSGNGFLDDDVYRRLKSAREGAFAAAPARGAAHAGSAYPAEPEPLAAALAAWTALKPAGMPGGYEPAATWEELPDGERPAEALGALVGIAAPHVSPEGGFGCYGAAYAALGPEHAARTFVAVGTSHYGEPDRFGLTRKPYRTPLGETTPDLDLVDELAAQSGAALVLEDYCHAVEHSIEFQVLFLQHLFGPRVRVLPLLCGPFSHGRSGQGTGEPEGVTRVIETLSRLARRERGRLFWVLGVDLAHVGRRYGDAFDARAGNGRLLDVARRDFARLARLADGDAAGFWDDVQDGGEDALRWCGASPLYTFLRAVPCRGRLTRYEQWNIDPGSVVSFGALRLHALPDES